MKVSNNFHNGIIVKSQKNKLHTDTSHLFTYFFSLLLSENYDKKKRWKYEKKSAIYNRMEYVVKINVGLHIPNTKTDDNYIFSDADWFVSTDDGTNKLT